MHNLTTHAKHELFHQTMFDLITHAKHELFQLINFIIKNIQIMKLNK